MAKSLDLNTSMRSIYMSSPVLLHWNWDNRMIALDTNRFAVNNMGKVSRHLTTANHSKA